MPNYYLHRDGQNHGPYPTEELKRLVASGEIKPDEPVCPEGGSEWVAASSLTRPTAPRATMLGHSHSHSAAVATLSQRPITLDQVQEARLKMKLPAMGMLFSLALPVILWAAKSDAERGVGVSGRHKGLKQLATDNTDLLPLAIVVGIIGFIAFLLWFRKVQKHAKLLRASYEHQRG